ncbi:MAG TPA: hypothetical protein DCZ91_16465 [Lachnospiraceae bacterium]|nr:hypothetical protein [Lachnospiraceae bacterium]
MEEKYWKQFEKSGRIEDYLSFVNSAGRDTEDVPFRADAAHAEDSGIGKGALSTEGVYSGGSLDETRIVNIF